jgi:hypothetical protein
MPLELRRDRVPHDAVVKGYVILAQEPMAVPTPLPSEAFTILCEVYLTT